MKEFYKPEFIPVFSMSLQDERLQKFDCLVLGTIYWYEKLKDGKCFASNESIARVINSDSPKSVSNSIAKLSKLGYVTCDYADGRKLERTQIRFHPQMVQGVSTDVRGGPSTDTQNKNNIEKNNEGEASPSRKPDYLLNIPEADIDTFRKKYKATKSEIIIKGEALHNWAGSVGKKYKDYRLFLMNALLRDYGLRELDTPGVRL